MSRQIRRDVRNRRKVPARGARGRGSNWVWYVAMAVVTAIVIAGFMVSDNLRRTTATDPQTLCPTSGPTGAIAVLLDLTDPINESQNLRLKTILGREIAQATAGTFISVGVVSEDQAQWGAQFSRCKPLEEADANPLFQNPQQIGRVYNSEFVEPLKLAIDDMMTREVEDNSPIMESLQALISETPELETNSGTRKLILVSDMLQNSATLSFYRGEFWDAFDTNGGRQRLSRDLPDVQVMLIRIARQDSARFNPNDVDTFWLHYFDLQGANGSFDVRPLGDL